jgi:hypothetical protein
MNSSTVANTLGVIAIILADLAGYLDSRAYAAVCAAGAVGCGLFSILLTGADAYAMGVDDGREDGEYRED